jgi:hypothetical protein
MRLLRIDELLAEMNKPGLRSNPNIRLTNQDTLVICAGFEERAVAGLILALHNGSSSFTVLMFEYLPHVSKNRTQEIATLCHESGSRLIPLVYDRESPSGAAEQVLDNLANASGNTYIDISGMSRLLIVQLVVALAQRPAGFEGCQILYTEANEYPPTVSEVQTALSKRKIDSNTAVMFLSSGVFEVCIVPELSSVALQGQPTRLVAFPSFNTDQFAALRSVVQPSFFTIVNGRPPDERYLWRLEAIRQMNSVSELPNCQEVETSTLDYRETMDVLLKLYARHGALERLVVAPTGSKMQAVGLGIVRAYLDDIQVIYPIPRAFENPESYTLGVKEMYEISLSSFPAATA